MHFGSDIDCKSQTYYGKNAINTYYVNLNESEKKRRRPDKNIM